MAWLASVPVFRRLERCELPGPREHGRKPMGKFMADQAPESGRTVERHGNIEGKELLTNPFRGGPTKTCGRGLCWLQPSTAQASLQVSSF